MPVGIVGKTLWPWQQQVVDDCNKEEETRIVNLIYDAGGKQGKSTLRKYLFFHKIAFFMPPITDMEDMMNYALMAKAKAYVLDLPRGFHKRHEKKQFEFWNGIEALKDGVMFDARHTSRVDQAIRDPHIWMFGNELPKKELLSADRWRIWLIDPKEKKLIPFTEKRAENIGRFVAKQRMEEESKSPSIVLDKTEWDEDPVESRDVTDKV